MTDLGNKAIMAENIKRYMNKNKISRKQLSTAIGTPYTTVCDWINGKTYPRIDKIEKMAKLFGTDKASLVENYMRDKDVNIDSMSTEEVGIIKAYRSSDKSIKDAIKTILNYSERRS